MLRCQENLFVGGQGLFKSTNAGFAAYYKRSHHMGKDDHIADGHHGKFLALEFFFCSCQLILQEYGCASCNPAVMAAVVRASRAPTGEGNMPSPQPARRRRLPCL